MFDHDPGLARFLQKSPASARGRVGGAMAAAALERNGVADPVADRALRALDAGEDVTVADREAIRVRVEDLDESYFDLGEEVGDDESRKQEVIVLFRRARAMNALMNACAATSSDVLLDAAYEALYALGLDAATLHVVVGFVDL
jgi:hypothetical protein